MGRYRNTGLARGTSGSPQRSKENSELEKKVRHLSEELSLEKKEREEKRLEQGIRELENAKVKFKKEDVLFVTRDKTGQLIWLEKGNKIAGLDHILHGDGKRKKGHEDDFVAKHKIGREKVVDHIRKVIAYGKVEYSTIKIKKGKPGYEKLYLYRGKYYMVGAIGLNGFVVSAYPVDSADAKERIEKNRK